MRRFAMLVAVSIGLIAADLAYGEPQDPGVDAQTEAPLKASEQRSEREAASAPAESPPPPAQELKGQSDDEALATATEETPELFAPVPTAPFELRPGDKVGQYLSSFSARIEDRNRKPQGLVVSTIPLRVKNEAGELEPTEFSLEKTPDGFRSQAPVIPVEYPTDVSDPITVGSSVRFRFAGADDATGTIVGQQVFWANAMTDTDLLATPLPLGVETFAQLRSEKSPKRLRLSFELPDGAVLRQALNSAGEPTGWIEAARGNVVLAQIPPAVSTDANDQPVASRYEIDGQNLDAVVDHGPGSAYPLLVDPTILDYQFGSDPSNTNGFISDGFGWFRNAAGVPLSSFSFVPNSDNNTSGGGCPRPNGAPTVSSLCVGAYQGANYGSLSLGDWTWRPPAGAQVLPVNPDGTPNDAYVYRLDMRSAFFLASGATNTYLYSGLLAPRRNNWIGVSNDSASPTVKSANPYTLTTSNSSFYRTYCIDTTCSDTQTDSTVDGTYARWGIGAGRSNAGGISTMQGAAMYQGDRTPASVAVTFNQALWYRAGTTITVNGQDKGLGMRAVSLNTTFSNGQQANPQSISSCNGTRTNRCPLSYTNAFPLDTTLLNEGPVPVTALAQDILGKSSTQALTVKVDRTPPQLTLGGSLYDARDGFVGPDRDYTLSASAVDGSLSPATAQRSGATYVEAVLDPETPNAVQLANSPASASCTRPEGSCSLALQTTLSAATISALDPSISHSVRITAKDALGQPTVTTIAFKVDDVQPTIDKAGTLDAINDLDPRPLTGNSYTLTAQAQDNRPFQPEADDDGTDGPYVNAPGAGLKDVVIRLDGQSVPTTTGACIGDASTPCEGGAQTWNWDTTGVANGEHTISITASDKVDNQNVDSFVVDIERRPDEPARSDDTVRQTIVGAATGDRAGTSVAALGDINSDGYADYAVGAPGATSAGRLGAGTTYLIMGSASPGTIDLSTPAGTTRQLLGNAANAACGTSVAAAGDVNGDGVNDLLVGCPGVDSRLGALSSAGSVFVVFGRTLPQDIDLANIGTAGHGSEGFKIQGPTDGSSLDVPPGSTRPTAFGEALQSAPNDPTKSSQDVNGDGLADIVIGDSASGALGAAYVIYGKTDSTTVSATNLVGTGGYVITGDRTAGRTGYAAAVAGDVDGDLLADVIVGSPGAASTDEGRAYVVSGATSNPGVDLSQQSARFVALTSGQAGDHFGVTVTGLGDTDLDERDDLAVGTSSGAYVLRSIPTTSRVITSADGFRVTGPTNAPLLSTMIPKTPVSGAGDIDGDQRADLVVGYPDVAGARGYTVVSPEDSRTIDLAALPGQRGASINTGTQNDRAGAAVGANSYQGTTPVSENGQAIVGAPAASPNLRVGAGQAYVVADRTPSGPGVLPDDTNSDDAPAAPAKSASISPENPRRYSVQVASNTRWATVRQEAGSLVFGNANDGVDDTGARIPGGGFIDANRRFRRGAAYGRVGGSGGNFAKDGKGRYCGFVFVENLALGTARPGGSATSCRSSLLKEKRFASLINVEDTSFGTLTRLVNVPPEGIPLWRNVQPFRGRREKGYDQDCTLMATVVRPGSSVPQPRQVRWRYVTAKGGFVLVQLVNNDMMGGPNRDQKQKTECGDNAWGYVASAYLPPKFLNTSDSDPNDRYGSLCQGPSAVKAQRKTHKNFPLVCALQPTSLPGSTKPPQP